MHILFFAHLKDVTGHSEVEWPDAGALGSAELWERLIDEFPELAGHCTSTRLARNGAYVADEEVFQAGDEVALIPPVSGG
jgi:molybdopterin converting factor small subunit